MGPRIQRMFTAGIVSVVTAASFFAAAPAMAADGDTVTKAEVAAAINGIEAQNGVLVAEPVPSTTDVDSAAVVRTDELTTEVPKDPSDGVTLDTPGAPPITISLPGDDAKDAARLSDGTVVYGGQNGAANAVVPVQGGVQMLVTIADRDAPTRYAYEVEVPDGGSIQLNDDGSATVVDADGGPLLGVPTPWAKDARGAAVPTHFEVGADGRTLIQVVDHQSGAYAYPVVADPFWIAPAVLIAVAKTAVIWCGIGWLGNSVWQIVWNGWVWSQVVRAGKQGCVEGVVGRFIPWHLAKGLIRR